MRTVPDLSLAARTNTTIASQPPSADNPNDGHPTHTPTNPRHSLESGHLTRTITAPDPTTHTNVTSRPTPAGNGAHPTSTNPRHSLEVTT